MINLVSGSKTLLTVTGVDAIGRTMAIPDPVSFAVDRPDIADVSSDGWLSAVAEGDATVTVTSGELSPVSYTHLTLPTILRV